MDNQSQENNQEHSKEVVTKENAHTQPVPLEQAQGAVASMVCGIVGVVLNCLPFVGLTLGIIAIVLYAKANKLIRESGGQLEGKSMATAGLVLGIISVLFGGFYLVYFLLFGAIFSTAACGGLMSGMQGLQ